MHKVEPAATGNALSLDHFDRFRVCFRLRESKMLGFPNHEPSHTVVKQHDTVTLPWLYSPEETVSFQLMLSD